jgi:hypothetical protein
MVAGILFLYFIIGIMVFIVTYAVNRTSLSFSGRVGLFWIFWLLAWLFMQAVFVQKEIKNYVLGD